MPIQLETSQSQKTDRVEIEYVRGISIVFHSQGCRSAEEDCMFRSEVTCPVGEQYNPGGGGEA